VVSRAGAGERLARLLAIVPWVVAQDGPLLAEVSERFGVPEEELVQDLELLFMCGVYPFTPDSLIEVDIEGARVWVRFADWFRRPLRLTAPEGLALLAAARAVLATPAGAGAASLSSAVAKLEHALGTGVEGALAVEPGKAAGPVLATLQAAARDRRKVRLFYYSFGRDETTERVVHPWQVFSSEGNWYLLAWCELVEGRRLFRVDRARSATVLAEGFEPPGDLGPLDVYQARPEDPLVVLDLAPEARWVAGRYPNEGTEELGDGRLRVWLRVSSRAWLERLLLRAGPATKVVSGADGVAAEAARRVLAVYGYAGGAGTGTGAGAGSGAGAGTGAGAATSGSSPGATPGPGTRTVTSKR
jgi:proteasome accessory factor C